MKLLGWMHSILRQKGNEPPNNTAIIVSGNLVTTLSAHREVKSNGAEMVMFQEEQLFDEIFPGFLAIGTLGNYNDETTNTDPPTPTFPMHVETEKKLKFINDELEKFLEEKVNEEFIFERTIDNKHIESTGAMEECPLQKYLLGSSVDQSQEIESEVKLKLKQQKGLFKKKNKFEGKDNKKDAAHFMKKILQNLQPKSKSSNVTASVSSKKKLPQVLKMFYRKVHPVNENNNLEDNEIRNNNIVSCKPGNLTNFSPKKEVINREHWIKTDRDYLVLEL